MHIHRRAVHRLGERRLDRIGEHIGDTPQVDEVAELDWFAVLRAGDHRGHALADLIHRTGQHDDLHQLGRRGEHDLLGDVVLARVHGDGTQRAGRHFGDARHEDRVDTSLVHSLLGEGDEQVLRGGDGGHLTAQAPVDELGVGQRSLAAARGTAFGTGGGDAHARLAQHGGRVDAASPQRIDQRDRRRGLALAARRLERRIGGDEHDLAVLARRVGIVVQVLHKPEGVDLLDQPVLAGELLDSSHQ